MSLELKNVSVQLGSEVLFANLSVTVAPGEVATLMGPSGSGKSTLLAYVAGFLAPQFSALGSVQLNGVELIGQPPAARSVGLVFQDDLLFPHMSVGENLGFGLKKRRGEGRMDRLGRIVEALNAAGLGDFIDRRPQTLSGGQRARVSLLRSLLAEPQALLLDEPFSKLDTDLRAAFRGFVFRQLEERAIPALMVTHDITDSTDARGITLDLHQFRG